MIISTSQTQVGDSACALPSQSHSGLESAQEYNSERICNPSCLKRKADEIAILLYSSFTIHEPTNQKFAVNRRTHDYSFFATDKR